MIQRTEDGVGRPTGPWGGGAARSGVAGRTARLRGGGMGGGGGGGMDAAGGATVLPLSPRPPRAPLAED